MTKIGKFIISNEIKEEMKNLVNKTSKDNIERGFNLCETPGKKDIQIASKCIGNFCSLELSESKCKPGDKEFGSFHTHPSSDVNFMSSSDIYSSHLNKEKVSCIGTSKDINCFIPIKSKGCNKSTSYELRKKQISRGMKLEEELEIKHKDQLYPFRMDYEKVHNTLKNTSEMKINDKKDHTESKEYLNKCFKKIEI